MISKTSRLKTLIFLVLAVALVAHLALFLGVMYANPDGFFRGDSVAYWQLSENIVHHVTFSQDQSPPFKPAHDRTALYPFFLAVLIAIGLTVPSIIFVQILFSIACCLLVILLSYRLTGEWTPGILAVFFLPWTFQKNAHGRTRIAMTKIAHCRAPNEQSIVPKD
jgi:4-amino-4-deoxy-L-arabinose transferase-like glycosyltransferase